MMTITTLSIPEVIADTWGVFTKSLIPLLPLLILLIACIGISVPFSSWHAMQYAPNYWYINTENTSWITILACLLQLLITGATFFKIHQITQATPCSVAHALHHGFQRLWRFLWVSVDLAILLILGYILFLIPGIILTTFLTVAVPVVILEKTTAIVALERSMNLVKGNWWRCSIACFYGFCPILLLCFILGLFLTLGSGTMLHSPQLFRVLAICLVLLSIVLAFVWICVFQVVLWYHLKHCHGEEIIELAA